jgi:hypothetical protein
MLEGYNSINLLYCWFMYEPVHLKDCINEVVSYEVVLYTEGFGKKNSKKAEHFCPWLRSLATEY